tara:strand:+ start:538 stop:1671 length:1134 start_codon:yes stop_codon:yes gene_type:complete
MLRYLKILFEAGYDFLPPKKNEVLVYDYHSKDAVSKILKTQKISFLSTRKERINLYVVFKTFLELKFKYFDYIINFIKFVNPKILITSIDNNKEFYRIKNFIPHLTTIFFQGGHRTGGNGDIFQILEEKNIGKYKKKYQVDLMCVFNQMTSNFYKKFISGNTYVSGSIKNNFEKINKKKEGVILVSVLSLNRKPFKKERQLIKIVKKYCEEKRLRLKILGRFKNNSDKKFEKSYFSNILNKNFTFIENSKKRKTYQLLDRSEIVVSSGSTLGLESLGRQNKTAIIQVLPNKYPYKKSFWGYFTKRKESGFFWLNDISEKKVFKTLNNLKLISDFKWKNKIKNYKFETCDYDYKNLKLKNMIEKFCKKQNFNLKPFLK